MTDDALVADDQPLWRPDPERAGLSRMAAFARDAAGVDPAAADAYAKLHDWSLADPARFWSSVWDACGLKGEKGARHAVDLDRMPGARFFPDARLNAAENLIERGGASDEVIVFWTETGRRRVWTRRDLKEKAGRFAAALAAAGVRAGDRVAAMMPNMPETVAAFLGTAWVGGAFASCSPDFGVDAVVDRFGQIEPRVLVACAGYRYKDKTYDITPKLQEIKYRMPSLEAVIVVPYEGDGRRLSGYPSFHMWNDFLAVGEGGGQPYAPVSFDHPLYVLFSSGTTGKPKCITHGTGRALIQHFKEHALHCDIRARDRVFFYTTCGWMMWNWLVSALGQGATIILFDGSPMAQDGRIVFQMAEEERATFLGLAAKLIDEMRKAGLEPGAEFDLSTLRTVASTGSPLAPENFDFVYEEIKADIHLASIAGGTDIVSCFMLGDPLSPVYRGQLQRAGLGMAVEAFDEKGKALKVGKPGELVCAKPFPSMPVGFWNDPDGARYHAAYFSDYPGVWRHGDWVERTKEGGFIIHGRSDATLNPGGVRIGTAEIYNQVEALDEIAESVAVGQNWQDDQRIILFVRLAENVILDAALKQKIKARIRSGASPRHVPAKIIAVEDIPRTKTGKVTELAVRDAIHGRTIKNVAALANPDALEQFADVPELAE
ncbi:MAG: acetoacetate--CoA ligase [Caulobacterales bacterium]|nr:acetoacetate--CoA ligase [Caulobacterales bacterium]